ncbi:MAG: RsmB/NOP family class I SAM-dependent RNA methyltransferase [Candidatus Lokiarchaeota archaeon]|nr:RsmB/NOP family class I SAM-dependent RNA methyltransferase [Candidatus Lokiarchaeota archaeon]
MDTVIIDLLEQYLERKKANLSEKTRSNSKIIYYYNEIVRFWNKLNFMIKKTLRSLEYKEFNNHQIAILLYLAYRMKFEGILEEELYLEVDQISLKYPIILDFIKKLKTFSWKRALEGKTENEKLSLNKAIPSFFIERLSQVMSIEQIKDNHETMNDIKKSNYFTVHVSSSIENTLNLCFIGNLQKLDNKNRSIFKKDTNIDHLYTLPREFKSELVSSELYQNGEILIVDKGSVAVIDVLDPKPHDIIGDLCAAPGIKTYLMTKHATRIIASDFHVERANSMKKLLKHLNTPKIPIINADGIQFPVRDEYQFDKILLDAPCTGSGTFLHNPELKWRQSEKFLHQNTVLQKKLLKSALNLLKPEGILVYSTCSLYPEEGELQIKNIIDTLEPLELPEWFSPSYRIENQTFPGTGRLFPAIHGTQGFFIGKFKKKG